MNKEQFFKGFKPKTSTVDIDGKSIEIRELTLAERGRLREISADPVRGQALIVCISCTMFEESDVDAVMEMSGDGVTRLADAVLALSGLTGEEAEKN